MTGIRKPSDGIVALTCEPDASPVAQLADTAEATAWTEEVLAAITKELTDPRNAYRAPEHPLRAYLDSLKLLLEKLQTRQPVELWEVHRELARANSQFHDDSFTEACTLLFG
ncbi:MAG: hypothetical protein RL150_254 [Candidatus Parcubacteria bacterium]|jgi:fructoselysine-6-P-deglycase FrlB-like protein